MKRGEGRGGEIALVLFAGAALAVAGWMIRDYRGWKALGEGGIPWGVRGWVSMTLLKPKMLRDSTDTSRFPRARESALEDLPLRRGARPRVAPYPVPHRQAGGDVSPDILHALNAMIDAELALRGGEGISKQESGFERHHDALFSRPLLESGASATGEVIHVHQPQGTVHAQMTADDARAVIDAGWGERHGLSGRGFNLPDYYILLYAPRDIDELDVIRRISSAVLDSACRGG